MAKVKNGVDGLEPVEVKALSMAVDGEASDASANIPVGDHQVDFFVQDRKSVV